MASLDDQSPVGELSQRLAHGDEAALREAYDRWGNLVYSLAVRVLGNFADAEDVTQQVFVAAWESRETLKPSDTALPSWLVGITRFKTKDYMSSRGRAQRNQELATSPEVAPPDPEFESIADKMVVKEALDELGEPKASIIRRIYLYDQTQQQVADELGLPLGTVKSHARRGLDKLKQALEEVSAVHV